MVETELPPQVLEYKIGPGDVLNVVIVGHPEFSGTTKSAQGEIVGIRVQKDGKLYLPMLPGLPAASDLAAESDAP